MSRKPNLQPHFLINMDSIQSGKTGQGSFVDGKKVARLASKLLTKGDPSVPFVHVTVSFRSLISLNVTNSIPETANDNYENLVYLLEHLWHLEIPTLSPSLLPPQRILY